MQRALLGTPRRCKNRTSPWAHGMRLVGMAVGGEIFALRRPRPYSRAFAGRGLRAMSLTIIYAHAGIKGNGGG